MSSFKDGGGQNTATEYDDHIGGLLKDLNTTQHCDKIILLKTAYTNPYDDLFNERDFKLQPNDGTIFNWNNSVYQGRRRLSSHSKIKGAY
jgi:hypothetical protein